MNFLGGVALSFSFICCKMKLMAIHFWKNKPERFLVLDFGSSAVKALLAVKEKNGGCLITNYQEQTIDRFGVFQAKNFPSPIFKQSLAKLFQELDLPKKKDVLKTIICLPPDVLRAVVLEVSCLRKEPHQKINKQEKEALYKEVKHQLGGCLFQWLKAEGSQDPADYEILKQKILQRKVSGYPVSSLLGQRGERLNFKALVLFGLKAHLDFMQEMLKVFQLDDIRIHHPAEGLLELKKTVKGLPKVFIDVGSHFCQFFVFNDILEAVGSFKMGGSDFSKALKQSFGLTESETENLKELFSQGKLSGKVKEKVITALAPVEQLFAGHLQQNLKRAVRGVSLRVEQVAFYGGGSQLPGLQSALQEANLLPSKSISSLKINQLAVGELPVKTVKGLNLPFKAVPVMLLILAAGRD